MTPSQKLAAEIAAELFRNGMGEVADRLVLDVNGKDGGGYCRTSVERIIAARIESVVQDAEHMAETIHDTHRWHNPLSEIILTIANKYSKESEATNDRND
jgi:hypothetical protein